MEIKIKNWGVTKKGEEVLLYTLKNKFLEVEILNYGGIIRKIATPDKNGNFETVVLNLPNIQDYETRSPYFGAILGRNGGRIKDATFTIDGSTYTLAKNSGEDSIHGGIENFSHKIWKSSMIEGKIEGKDFVGVELSLHSPHLEEGFPGDVDILVKYILKDNELSIEYFGISDRKTYLNLTNHTYFNLSGNFKTDVKKHHLNLDSDRYIEVDTRTLPTKISDVTDTPFDFRNFKSLEESLGSNHPQIEIVNGGLDHPFILNRAKDYPITLWDEKSGRVLNVQTDQPAVVIYTGNYLNDVGELEGGVKSTKHIGICFETQNYADAMRFLPEYARYTTPETPYVQKTKYIFSLK